MITNTKLALIAAIAAVGIASPVFAQSFDPDMGTGNLVASSAGPAASQAENFTSRGLQAYAMIPSAQPVSTSIDPAATGGGSRGYNENLLKNQW
jgi:hypothetical protein